MARKGWDDLSNSYRGRLERAGFTRERYEAGESLARARGHAATPEHPLPATQLPPENYKKWFAAKYGNPIKTLTTEGEIALFGVSKADRSLIGSHWNAMRSWLLRIPMPDAWWWPKNNNVDDALQAFLGRTVIGEAFVNGALVGGRGQYELLTHPDDIETWMYGGELSFEDIYEAT